MGAVTVLILWRKIHYNIFLSLYTATPVEIIYPEDNSTTIGEGGALVLKCSSGEDSQVTWFLNNNQINPEPRVIFTYPENQLHILTVMNVQMHDAGTYRCQNVANYYNRDFVDVNVIKANNCEYWIKSSPLFKNCRLISFTMYKVCNIPCFILSYNIFAYIQCLLHGCNCIHSLINDQLIPAHGVTINEPSMSRAFVLKGTTFNAKCTGNGSRHLEWRHNGIPLSPSTRLIITSAMFKNDVIESQLKINNVQMYDGGDYQCQDTDDFVLSDRRTLIVVVPRKC